MTTKYETDVIYGWNGGECPVHPETEVRAWRRNLGLPILWQAKLISWRHHYGDADIIAFQVVKPYVEPKVIWVNEYPDELVAYPDEQSARAGASILRPPMRTAVKYVEAQDD